MKVKSLPIGQVKAGPEDGLKEGEFLVYPSTFTRKPDAYGDVVAKGAFLDDIAAWKDSGNALPGLYGHRMDDPDFFVAGAADMGEDDHGWWVKGEFDLEAPKAKQVYRLVKGRRLNQLSFAYDVLEEGKTELGDGETANELRKLKVLRVQLRARRRQPGHLRGGRQGPHRLHQGRPGPLGQERDRAARGARLHRLRPPVARRRRGRQGRTRGRNARPGEGQR